MAVIFSLLPSFSYFFIISFRNFDLSKSLFFPSLIPEFLSISVICLLTSFLAAPGDNVPVLKSLPISFLTALDILVTLSKTLIDSFLFLVRRSCSVLDNLANFSEGISLSQT